MAKLKYGYMKCETRRCKNGEGAAGSVVVFQNTGKDGAVTSLVYRCDECQKSPYAIAGTDAFRQWESEIEKIASPAPAAAPKPAPAKPAAGPKDAPAATVKPAASLLG